MRAGRELARQVSRELVGEDRAESGDADRPADLAEERRAGTGYSEVLVVDRVLGGEHEHLHDETEAEPENDHVAGDDERRGVGVDGGEQPEPEGRERRPCDRERPVVAEAGDQLPARDRGDQQAGHHRRDQQPRGGRTVALHVLEVERQVRDGPEERQADDEADGAGDGEDADAKELQRQDRLSSPRLHEHERGKHDDTCDDEGDHLRRAPGVGRAAETRVEDDRGEAAREQDRAEVVDRLPGSIGASLEDDADHGERDEADRQVDVEDPAPGEVVDEEAAEQRPDHGRDAEDPAEVALVAAAFAGRDDVPDHGDRDHDQAAGAEPLDRAETDQLGHVLAQPAQHRAGEEDHDRRLQHDLSAVEVAQLAVHRTDHRRGEQVRRDDPGELRDSSEVADDRRQRRRDDRLVERGEQQHEQERAEDQAHARLIRASLGHPLAGPISAHCDAPSSTTSSLRTVNR